MNKEIILKEKELIVEQLKKTPIITVSCEKTGIAKATFYRWKKDDKKFSIAADDAIITGSQLINDLAESQLVSAIKDRNLTAIIYWLNHHHKTYETKVHIEGKIKTERVLTLEEQKCIKKALELSRLSIGELINKNK